MQRNKTPLYPLLILTILMILSAAACGSADPTEAPPTDEVQPPTSVPTDVVESADTPPPPSPTSPPEATQIPTNTPITHLTQPGDPAPLATVLSDASSAALAEERRANADTFNINLLERPFTSQTMDYQDYLDIILGQIGVEGDWLYVNVHVEGAIPQGSSAAYGVEIDLDEDGRGDWFITGASPSSTAWSASGMQVWQDSDDDLGGSTPVQSDAPDAAWNGFDDLVFDLSQNISDDNDLAWIRLHPSEDNVVQLAFKYTLINNAPRFFWSVWADEGVRQPGWMDYNDHFTLAEAGSPVANSADYPLKALASVDNTCRWSYGFTPLGNEPGLCYIPPTPTPPPPPTATPGPGSISGKVFNDRNANKTKDGGEEGLAGWSVTLGLGNCNSSGYSSTTTNGNGNFTFNNIPAGTYCVQIVHPGGAWIATTKAKQTVTVQPDKNTNAGNFGWVILNFTYYDIGLYDNLLAALH